MVKTNRIWESVKVEFTAMAYCIAKWRAWFIAHRNDSMEILRQSETFHAPQPQEEEEPKVTINVTTKLANAHTGSNTGKSLSKISSSTTINFDIENILSTTLPPNNDENQCVKTNGLIPFEYVNSGTVVFGIDLPGDIQITAPAPPTNVQLVLAQGDDWWRNADKIFIALQTALAVGVNIKLYHPSPLFTHLQLPTNVDQEEIEVYDPTKASISMQQSAGIIRAAYGVIAPDNQEFTADTEVPYYSSTGNVYNSNNTLRWSDNQATINMRSAILQLLPFSQIRLPGIWRVFFSVREFSIQAPAYVRYNGKDIGYATITRNLVSFISYYPGLPGLKDYAAEFVVHDFPVLHIAISEDGLIQIRATLLGIKVRIYPIFVNVTESMAVISSYTSYENGCFRRSNPAPYKRVTCQFNIEIVDSNRRISDYINNPEEIYDVIVVKTKTAFMGEQVFVCSASSYAGSSDTVISYVFYIEFFVGVLQNLPYLDTNMQITKMERFSPPRWPEPPRISEAYSWVAIERTPFTERLALIEQDNKAYILNRPNAWGGDIGDVEEHVNPNKITKIKYTIPPYASFGYYDLGTCVSRICEPFVAPWEWRKFYLYNPTDTIAYVTFPIGVFTGTEWIHVTYTSQDLLPHSRSELIELPENTQIYWSVYQGHMVALHTATGSLTQGSSYQPP